MCVNVLVYENHLVERERERERVIAFICVTLNELYLLLTYLLAFCYKIAASKKKSKINAPLIIVVGILARAITAGECIIQGLRVD